MCKNCIPNIIKNAENKIKLALVDYFYYVSGSDITESDFSDRFVSTLAKKSTTAKQGLREIFKKSQSYDENLDAIVINSSHTSEPDQLKICALLYELLNNTPYDTYFIDHFLSGFLINKLPEDLKQITIEYINKVTPDAYKPGKKLSRVLRDICRGVGVYDEKSGSKFQKLYAQLADEINAKKIDFTLYISINPAHFLTMSNPKYDKRGSTLVSCHSLNNTDYGYKNGCVGYALDDVSFVVFTADPKNPESLNNRKTTRQIFAYKNGVLLQSRLYNTQGGVNGESEISKTYRNLVQKELSFCEDLPNLWITSSDHEKICSLVEADPYFQGYTDWTHDEFKPKISIRKGLEGRTMIIGKAGLCINCGCELNLNDDMFCNLCKNSDCCECCGAICADDDLNEITLDGEEQLVCTDCICYRLYQCECCGEYFSNRLEETSNGYVCLDCIEENYAICDICGYYKEIECFEQLNIDHEEKNVCYGCIRKFEFCKDCNTFVELNRNGVCMHCHGNNLESVYTHTNS